MLTRCYIHQGYLTADTCHCGDVKPAVHWQCATCVIRDFIACDG